MDTLKVWDVEVGEDGQKKLVHAASVTTDDDEAQVSDMAVSEGMLATIWRFGLFCVTVQNHHCAGLLFTASSMMVFCVIDFV